MPCAPSACRARRDEQERRRAEAGAAWSRSPPMKRRARSTHASPANVPGRVLVESPVRVDRREDPGRAARRQLRARGHPAARARPLRGHGARVGEASGDARLSRQLPVDRPGSPRAARSARRPPAPRPERELRARAAGAAHARRRTAATRSRTCRSSRRSHRLDDRRPRRGARG